LIDGLGLNESGRRQAVFFCSSIELESDGSMSTSHHILYHIYSTSRNGRNEERSSVYLWIYLLYLSMDLSYLSMIPYIDIIEEIDQI
jgi:hypothetical protein